ncbi:uncharacterized protein Gasu_59690 [Galdieria sulphuraria]|uniref:Ornithine decarboxylase antizyme n=1 Tax=Galdieria sulphuraria TaxID=130081 RepID=M2X9B5_GALSU|nr:uncharacterized protein Gasu_59690 [Galdieria sulphuraria]EME26407.1 hypothetical protein Gasu_59690 [Galdieria sulphuraria]|eukprot:XP_005702927.1 hypothetical protein Gasu_59690 [Galdieria sulphuraria]
MAVGIIQEGVTKSVFVALVRQAVSQGGSFDVSRKLLATGYTTDSGVKTNVAAFRESDFYERVFSRIASKRADFWKDVSVTLVVSTVDTESDKVISVWNAFVTKDRQLFVEAPEVLTSPSKDTLICLLELAEELGCLQAFVCVNKEYKHFRELVRTFTYMGFALVSPREQTKLVSWRCDVSDYAILGYSLE